MAVLDGKPMIAQGRTAEIYAWETGKVLKLFRDWMPDLTIDSEAGRSRQISDTGLSVPKVYDVLQVDGRRGIIYERIDGPSMLTELKRRMWRIRHYARQMAELHARLHAVRLESLPSQRNHLRWKIEHARPLPDPLKQAALAALERLPEGNVVCHGDFHPDNILLSPRGPIIIDWMDATSGHPLADVARTLVLIKTGDMPPGTSAIMRWLINQTRHTLNSVYLNHYLSLTGASHAEVNLWLFPVAAARLEDAIPQEVGPLLAYIEPLRGA